MLKLSSHQKEHWDWFAACWAWDYADQQPLANLIRATKGTIPEDFSSFVADVVSGKRKPRKKAAVKLSVQPSELGALVGSLMVIRDLCHILKTSTTYGDPTLRGVRATAKAKGGKAIDYQRDLEREWRDLKDDAAIQLGVDVRSVERLIREADERVKRWPNF